MSNVSKEQLEQLENFCRENAKTYGLFLLSEIINEELGVNTDIQKANNKLHLSLLKKQVKLLVNTRNKLNQEQ